MSFRLAIRSSAALVVIAAAFGAVFAMWIENGPRIFLTYAQSGLAWCF